MRRFAIFTILLKNFYNTNINISKYLKISYNIVDTIDIVGIADIVGNVEIVGNVDIVDIVDTVVIVETIYLYFWSNLKQFQALIEAISKT